MQFWIYRRITFSFVRTAAVILACLCAAQLTHSKSLLVYGDSLSAGYGINPKDGWVELLQAELGTDHTLINASISGETSSGGRRARALTPYQSARRRHPCRAASAQMALLTHRRAAC